MAPFRISPPLGPDFTPQEGGIYIDRNTGVRPTNVYYTEERYNVYDVSSDTNIYSSGDCWVLWGLWCNGTFRVRLDSKTVPAYQVVSDIRNVTPEYYDEPYYRYPIFFGHWEGNVLTYPVYPKGSYQVKQYWYQLRKIRRLGTPVKNDWGNSSYLFGEHTEPVQPSISENLYIGNTIYAHPQNAYYYYEGANGYCCVCGWAGIYFWQCGGCYSSYPLNYIYNTIYIDWIQVNTSQSTSTIPIGNSYPIVVNRGCWMDNCWSCVGSSGFSTAPITHYVYIAYRSPLKTFFRGKFPNSGYRKYTIFEPLWEYTYFIWEYNPLQYYLTYGYFNKDLFGNIDKYHGWVYRGTEIRIENVFHLD